MSALFLLLTGALVVGLPGCGFGESGVEPEIDRIFLPTGIAADPFADWLYVVNSNSDLRQSAGTVVAVDLTKARDDRAKSWPDCPAPGFVPSEVALPFCCRDVLDRNVLNCDERGYVESQATVGLGSFGGAMVIQTFERGGEMVRRLFVAVRADPSVTVIESTLQNGRVRLRCHDQPAEPGAPCAENWRIGGTGEAEAGALDLPEEPFSLALDEKLGVLYVGHLGRIENAISSIDACGPAMPRLNNITTRVFANPAQGVTALTVAEPGNPLAPIYATGRTVSVTTTTAAEIQTLFLEAGTGVGCAAATGSTPRNLSLTPGRPFFSSAFYPAGRDLRGILFSEDDQRAYVLHRNAESSEPPSALVAVDRTRDQTGTPVNRAVDVVEVCGGPTEMRLHDSGRGPRLFVVCFESGQIYAVDPTLLTVTAIINIGRGPTGIAFPPGDATVAYVTAFTDNSVSVVDLRPGSETEYRVVQRIGFPRMTGR